MTKKEREEVFAKFDGHCAYCGKELATIGEMQISYIIPKRKLLQFVIDNGTVDLVETNKFNPDDESIDNCIPSCKTCGRKRGKLTLDEFRSKFFKNEDNLIDDKFYFENYGNK